MTEQRMVALLDEFFAPETNNDRRREIESELEGFKRRSECVPQCLQLLASPSNYDHLQLFLLNCVQVTPGYWMGLSQCRFTALREQLVHLVISKYKQGNVAGFVRLKLCEVLAHVAMQRWDQDMESALIIWLDQFDLVSMALNLISACLHLCQPNQLGTQHNFISFMQRRGLRSLDKMLSECLQALFDGAKSVETEELLGRCVEIIRSAIDLTTLPIDGSLLCSWTTSITQLMIKYLSTYDAINDSLLIECFQLLIAIISSNRLTASADLSTRLCNSAITLIPHVQSGCVGQRDSGFVRTIVLFLGSVVSVVVSKRSGEEESMAVLDAVLSTTARWMMTEVEMGQLALQIIWEQWMDSLELFDAESWSLKKKKASSVDETILRSLLELLEKTSEVRTMSNARHFDLPRDALEFDCSITVDDENDNDELNWPSMCRIIARLVSRLSAIFAHRVFHFFSSRIMFNLMEEGHSTMANDEWRRAQLRMDSIIMSHLAHLYTSNDDDMNELFSPTSENVRFVERITDALRPDHSSRHPSLEVDLLMCAQSRCQWLHKLYAFSQSTGQLNIQCSTLISLWMEAAISAIHSQSSSSCRAGTSLLRALLLLVRPHVFALSIPSLSALYDAFVTAKPSVLHTVEPSRSVFLVLTGYLILPWHQATTDEQQWPKRRKMLQALIAGFVTEIAAIIGNANGAVLNLSIEERDNLSNLIVTLNGVLDCATGQGTIVAGNMSVAVGDYCLVPLQALRRCRDSVLFAQLIDHVARLFKALALHVKQQYTSHIVLLLSHLGHQPELTGCALGGLAEVLIIVVEQQSRSTMGMMEGIVSLISNEHIVDQLSGLSPDSRHSFYHFLAVLFECRWRYFFPPTSAFVKQNNTSQQSTMDNNDAIDMWQPETTTTLDIELIARRYNQFIGLISMYYMPVFSSRECQLDIVQTVIASLRTMGKLGLYEKTIFTAHISKELLLSLMSMIVNGSPLQDELIELAWEVFSRGYPDDDFEQYVLATITCRFLHLEHFSPALWAQLAFRPCSEKWQFESEMKSFIVRLQTLANKQHQVAELADRTAATSIVS